MGFEDLYRLSAHGVILNQNKQVLQLKQTYGDLSWGLPGGAVDPGETVLDTIVRECREELGCDIEVECLTGVYLHKKFNSHVFIFRCSLKAGSKIKLSAEHSEFRYFDLGELSSVQKQRVLDCLNFNQLIKTAIF